MDPTNAFADPHLRTAALSCPPDGTSQKTVLSSTEKPGITFRCLDCGTGNLPGLYLDFLFSQVILSYVIWN